MTHNITFPISADCDDANLLAKAVAEVSKSHATRVAIRGRETPQGDVVTCHSLEEDYNPHWRYVDRQTWLNKANAKLCKLLGPRPGFFRSRID